MSYTLDQPFNITYSTFSDPAETVPADPTALTLDVSNPDGTITSHTWPSGDITRDSLGVFHYTITPTVAGAYAYHWKATGAVATALDGSFRVDAKFTHQVNLTVTDLATYINDPTIDTARATLILNLAIDLCETIVEPLPAGADAVVLDVAARAYSNPLRVTDQPLGLYTETMGEPPAQAGGLYLTENNKRALRDLAGRGGAFTIDTIPTTAATSLPWWDTGAVVFDDGLQADQAYPW